MKDSRKLYKNILILPLLIFISCGTPAENEQVYSGEALGTTYNIKFTHNETLSLQSGIDSIFRVINKSMSTYQADSDISRINAGDSAIITDENFRAVFEASERIYGESKGMFDPTVGKLVNAYGFGPAGPQRELSQDVLDSLRQFVGLNKLELRDNRIIKQHPEIYIDFNAIAKGYAVDVIAQFLDQRGVENYLAEIGGELVAKGINRTRDQPWAVGIDSPAQSPGERTLQTAVQLRDRAMATSGNYRKNRKDPVTGRYMVHTINPITGLAEQSDLLSVSVLAENCTLADGYATAFMALGYEGSLEMLTRITGVDVYFIYMVPGENEMSVYATPGFEEALLED